MNYVFSVLTPESLKKLYCEYGFRAKEIGTLVGLTESAVLLKLKKWGIPSNPRGTIRKSVSVEYVGLYRGLKNSLTDVLLRVLIDKGYTDERIGRMFHMTGEGIAYRRKRLGIIAKTSDEKRVRCNYSKGLKDIKELTPEELSYEISMCRGIKGVARRYSTIFSIVKDRMKEIGLNRDEILSDHIDLSDTQKKILVGGLLGDGGVYDGGVRGAYYKEGHCVEQLEYLQWKVSLLGNMIEGPLYYEKKTSALNTQSHGVSFRTKKYVELRYYRDLFYCFREGKWVKSLPEDTIRTLDSFVFSVWYFDDGGIAKNNLPYICSGSSLEEVRRASEILNERFSLDSYAESGVSVNFVFFRNKSAFFDMIKEHVLPCFYYKVPIEYRFNIPGLDRSVAELPVKIKGYSPQEWADISKEKQKEWIDDVVKYYSFIGFPFYRIRSRKETEGLLAKLANTDNTQEVLSTGIFDNSSAIGADLAGSYFPHMWAAAVRGKRSIYNNYLDSPKFRVVVENVFKHRKVLSDASVLSELRHGSSLTVFRPLIAKTLFDLYCPERGTVYDSFASYGGCLIGACVSSKVLSYIGMDSCEQTYFGLRKLQRKLLKYFPNKKIQIYNKVCSDESSVDVCFSGFDDDKYTESEIDSVITGCYRILKNGGYFIIDVVSEDRNFRRAVYEKLSNLMSYERFFSVCVPNYFSNDRQESIFIFGKKDGASNPSYEAIKDLEVIRTVSVYEPFRKRNTGHREFSEENKQKAKDCLVGLVRGSVFPSRNVIQNIPHSRFPFSVSRIERTFGGWNSFLIFCGVNVVYEAQTPVEHVQDYLSACKTAGKVLSFYEFEKITGHPATRLKRLFNAGKPYHHLIEELKLVAVDESLWPDFLGKLESCSESFPANRA